MSMLSVQVDELRKAALGARAMGQPETFVLMRDAADTIWKLRCRLVDAEDRIRKSGELCKLCEREAENDKLQNNADLLRAMWSQERTEKQCYMAENAKLRELVVEVFKCARRGAACETCKVNNDGYACVYIMRDLGVEVDE